MSIEAHIPQQNQTDGFRARQITPEEAEAGILNDLFQTVVQARIARHVLISRRSSWVKTDDQAKLLAENAMQVGEGFMGWVALPQRVPNFSIPTAASLVEAGHQASIELGERLMEEKRAELAEKYPEAEDSINSLLQEAAKSTIAQFRPTSEIDIKSLFTQISNPKLDPAIAAIETEKVRVKKEEEQREHKDYVNDMFQKNIRLVGFVVRRLASVISKSGLDFEDAVAEGQIGLLRAIESYDPSKGTIGTYGVSSIEHAILNAIDRYSPIPRGAMTTDRKVRKFATKFHTENGRRPSDTEISEGLHIRQDTLARTRKIMNTRQESMDAPTTLSEGEFADIDRKIGLEEKDETVLPEESLLIKEQADEQRMLQQAVALVLEELPPREATVLTMRHMQQIGLAEIGKEIDGVTRERARQLLRRSTDRFAAIATLVGLEKNAVRIMKRQTMTLREYLIELGMSYPTYNAHELGKGIRFKRKDNEGKRGRGQILVNPLQQEIIKARADSTERKKPGIKKGNEASQTNIEIQSSSISLVSFIENELGISYVTYFKHKLGEGLVFRLEKTPHTRGKPHKVVDEDQKQIIKNRYEAIVNARKKKFIIEGTVEIKGSISMSELLNNMGINHGTYKNYALGNGLEFKRFPGTNKLMITPEQQEIIKSRYQNREVKKRGRKPKNTK